MTIYDDINFTDHSKPRKTPEEVVRERFTLMRQQTLKRLQESTLPEWIKQIKCVRVDRTSDDSWLFQWGTGPCKLVDVYDSGTIVVIGEDPSPEIPDREAFCELQISDPDTQQWIEEFIRTGWRGVALRNQKWECKARRHNVTGPCPDVCPECKRENPALWLSMFNRI